MAITLKIAAMEINSHPHGCPECASEAFTLDGRGIFDAFPAWGNCPSGHAWEHPLITVGDLKQIKAASTGRTRAEDTDTFEIILGGARFTGTLQPEVTVDDIKKAVTRVYWGRIIRPALRRQKRRAIRGVTRPIKRAARDGVAAAKAAALGAAWTAQASGHQPNPDYTPEPVNPCPACKGKGRHKIDTRISDITHVDCTVCSGTGEID